MRVFNEIRQTTNSKIYKRICYMKVGCWNCWFCPPFKGDNTIKQRHPKRNWKKYRKNQYKEDY